MDAERAYRDRFSTRLKNAHRRVLPRHVPRPLVSRPSSPTWPMRYRAGGTGAGGPRWYHTESRAPVTTAMCRDRRSAGQSLFYLNVSTVTRESPSRVRAPRASKSNRTRSHEISLIFQRPDEDLGHLAEYALELRLVVALSLLRAHPRETEHASNERQDSQQW